MASLLKGKLLNTNSTSAVTTIVKANVVKDPTVKYADDVYMTSYQKTTNRFSEVKADPNTTIVSYATNNVSASRDNRGKCSILTFSDGKTKHVKRGENYKDDMFIGMTSERFNNLIEMEILITATK